MIFLLATLGLIVVVRWIIMHCIKYRKLKIENACLRRYWKDGMMSKS